MDAIFIELPIFSKLRENYLDDDGYRELQTLLIQNPIAGDVIQGTGGLRKLRFVDHLRNKGKRGGIRIIYYWRVNKFQFYLFTLYNKNEMSDLTQAEKKKLKELLDREIKLRSHYEKT